MSAPEPVTLGVGRLAIEDVVAVARDGAQVVRSQRLTTLDQDGLMERVRALTRDWADV